MDTHGQEPSIGSPISRGFIHHDGRSVRTDLVTPGFLSLAPKDRTRGPRPRRPGKPEGSALMALCPAALGTLDQC